MTVITGEAPTYEPEGTGIENEAGETVNIGTTQKEPYSVRVGSSDIFIRASSQEELDNFLAWLSLKSGKPVEELTALEFNRFVPPSLLSASESVTDPDNPGLVTVFGIEGQQWGSVDGFNDTEFFGDEIPSFPPGSGSFNGYNIKTGEGMKTSVGLFFTDRTIKQSVQTVHQMVQRGKTAAVNHFFPVCNDHGCRNCCC